MYHFIFTSLKFIEVKNLAQAPLEKEVKVGFESRFI